MEKFQILVESDISAGLSSEELQQLSEIAEKRVYKEGEPIVREDEQTRDLYIVYDGWLSVEVHKHHSSENVFRLQMLRSKGVVGEFSFLDGSRRSADVIAMDEVKVLVLPYQKLIELMESNNHLGYKLMQNIAKLLCDRVRSANFELRNQIT